MSWGIESLIIFNPFQFSAINICVTFVFLFVFGYIANRTKSDAVERSLETIGYSFVIGFILVLLGLPPFWCAALYVAGYILCAKYVSKSKTDFHWCVTALYLVFIFTVIPLLDEFSRTWWIVIATVILAALSELEVREKAKEKHKA
jgi:hypothetical protein